jgi:shikimate dehydrogenase
MTARPDQYVVIGNPVAHSKSPAIHAQFAAQTGESIAYERLAAPLDDFAACVHHFMQSGGRGANVTVPFKLEAFALATQLTPRAQAAGAVNTLSFDDGRIVGDNTDGVGLVRDIVHNAGVVLEGRRILLLGAGGAARGVVMPLLAERPQQLVVANRTVARAQELVQSFPAAAPVLKAAAFDDLSGQFDVIINATSASLSADLPAVPATLFGPQVFVYDMMYAATPTVFMQWAAQHGARVRDGLGMLVEQAAESFFVWRGARPDTAPVYALLRAQLAGST